MQQEVHARCRYTEQEVRSVRAEMMEDRSELRAAIEQVRCAIDHPPEDACDSHGDDDDDDSRGRLDDTAAATSAWVVCVVLFGCAGTQVNQMPGSSLT